MFFQQPVYGRVRVFYIISNMSLPFIRGQSCFDDYPRTVNLQVHTVCLTGHLSSGQQFTVANVLQPNLPCFRTTTSVPDEQHPDIHMFRIDLR